MKKLLVSLLVAGGLALAPATALADPVVGDPCEFTDPVTLEVVQGTLQEDADTGEVVCVAADGRSSWGRSSWGKSSWS